MAQHGTPTPTDTRGFGPPPSSPARASVRGQFASAWRRRSPPNWEGARRGAWFGGLAGLSPISLRCSRSGAAKLVPCGEGRISPAGIAGSICPCRHCHGTELCGARSRFQSRLFARFSSFSTSPFHPEPPPVPVTQVRPVPMGKVATWEGGTALSSGCLPPAAPPTLLWDQGQPQQPPSSPPAAPHLAGRGLAQREGKRRGPR